ncbi:MAG: hypothetical protein IE933_09630 [Sphingomonadales bacterium]|nr:hypothetical protein [Sphingomonadales bacterium]MBD3774702.1 hypothetical protein [Paracoccaceae bacterium]
MQKDVSFSNIIGTTFSTVSDGAMACLVYIALLGGLGTIGAIFGVASTQELGVSTGFMVDGSRGIGTALFQLVTAILSIVAGYYLIAKLLETRGLLRDTQTRIWAYIGLSILMGIGVVFGLILLIVPGIMLLVRWSAATGYLIGAREGVIESLSASWEATKGHSWPIFGAGLVLVIAYGFVAGMLGVTTGLATGSEGILIGAVSAFADAVGSVLSVAFTVAVYALVSNDQDVVGEVFA